MITIQNAVLLVPLVWVTVMAVVLNKPRAADGVRRSAFGFGFVLLGAIGLLILAGGCAPMMPYPHM